MASVRIVVPTSERIWDLLLLEVWPDSNISEKYWKMRKSWAHPVDVLIRDFDIASFAVYTTKDHSLARKHVMMKGARCSGV